MTPDLNSADIFVQCTYPLVSSSYVYSFGTGEEEGKRGGNGEHPKGWFIPHVRNREKCPSYNASMKRRHTDIICSMS